MRFIIVYITNPSKKEAKKIAKTLLKRRLIACANIFPIESLYWWKGKIIEEKEFVLIAKTVEKKFREVEKVVEKAHSYKTPCVIGISAEANKKFLNWVTNVIN